MKRNWLKAAAAVLATATALVALGLFGAGVQYRPFLNNFEIANRQAFPIPSSSGPLVCKDSVFDFGRIRGGDTIRATFPITNMGASALWIKVIQSGSGTTAEPRFFIKPGETIDVPVAMATGHANGKICKTIRVKPIGSIAPAAPPISLFGRLALRTRQITDRLLARAWCVISPAR
jgi:hypothetical protein